LLPPNGRLRTVTGSSDSIFGAANRIEFGAAQIGIKSSSCSGGSVRLKRLNTLRKNSGPGRMGRG
jgi:hypothetical protein